MPETGRQSPSWRRAVCAALGVFVFTSPGLDGPFLAWSRLVEPTFWGQLVGEAAYLAGLGWVQFGASAVLVALGLFLKRKPWVWLGVGCVLSAAASGILVQIVKNLVGRPRPRMELPVHFLSGPNLDSDFHSFPSGHTATSFALAAVLAWRFPRFGWLFYLLAALVGYGRVLSGSHYLSDVIAGAFVGIMVGIPLAVWTGRKIRSAA